MGQQQQTMESAAALRRIMLVVLVAALMALTMAASAMPALAKGGENFGGNGQGQGGGTGGDSLTNGSLQGVSNKEQSGVYKNPHKAVVVPVPELPTGPF